MSKTTKLKATGVTPDEYLALGRDEQGSVLWLTGYLSHVGVTMGATTSDRPIGHNVTMKPTSSFQTHPTIVTVSQLAHAFLQSEVSSQKFSLRVRKAKQDCLVDLRFTIISKLSWFPSLCDQSLGDVVTTSGIKWYDLYLRFSLGNLIRFVSSSESSRLGRELLPSSIPPSQFHRYPLWWELSL